MFLEVRDILLVCRCRPESKPLNLTVAIVQVTILAPWPFVLQSSEFDCKLLLHECNQRNPIVLDKYIFPALWLF